MAEWYREGPGLTHQLSRFLFLEDTIEDRRILEIGGDGPILAGYLLELVDHAELARPLAELLATRRVRPAPLRPDADSKDMPTNERWNVVVNERVEPDL